jgi:hypothetical protein
MLYYFAVNNCSSSLRLSIIDLFLQELHHIQEFVFWFFFLVFRILFAIFTAAEMKLGGG